jgi:hypothetical protein
MLAITSFITRYQNRHEQSTAARLFTRTRCQNATRELPISPGTDRL